MAREPDILIVTTDFLEGRPVRQHLGMVSAQAILGANVVLDLMAAIRDFFGGRSKGYERVLARAREDVDLDYHAIGPNGQMLMVAVNGSAVVL